MHNYQKITMSPKFMAPSPTLWENNAQMQQPWSTNSYGGFGGISDGM